MSTTHHFTEATIQADPSLPIIRITREAHLVADLYRPAAVANGDARTSTTREPGL